MTRRIIGVLLILVSIGTALDQLIRFSGWQWREMHTLWHHEGIALATFVIGAALLVSTLRLKS